MKTNIVPTNSDESIALPSLYLIPFPYTYENVFVWERHAFNRTSNSLVLHLDRLHVWFDEIDCICLGSKVNV